MPYDLGFRPFGFEAQALKIDGRCHDEEHIALGLRPAWPCSRQAAQPRWVTRPVSLLGSSWRAVSGLARWLLAAAGKPLLHHRNLTFLGLDHLFGEFADLWIIAVSNHDFRHIDRALMVRDHAAHEVDVGITGELDHHVLMHAVIGGYVSFRRRAVGCRHRMA
jgi:hypothetical protein